MIRIAFILLLISPIAANAQRTKTDVMRILNRGSEKVWLFDGTETVMKGSDQCDAGKYYLFRSDNKVVIAECVNNRWKRAEKSYSIRSESAVDWFIRVGEEEYYLVITEVPAYDEIKLRKFQGSNKADPALDIILKHLKDD